MSDLKKTFSNALLVGALVFASTVHSQEQVAVEIPEDSAIADGKLTKKELAKYAVVGQRQLVHLIKKATDQYSALIEGTTPNLPAAWMLMDDGDTVKRVNLDGQIEGSPAQVRILVYRAALKSIARRGKINAAAILYTGKLDDTGSSEALVIEHEHRLGISGNKVIPFEVEDGKVKYSDPVTRKKPYQIFYDEEAESNGQS
ncbi:hypothetical protein KEHDKFFH_08690 [Marinobacter maroccanus]|uniref:Uncharacterized protein n=1 Tax=Marinobacter maroccanus TaxID=2055143 RepID=A0A2S5ZBJ6_9GAMM|nr:hypothetical protein [Marinobacter maroccanus]PPI84766.1 hypothetical protein KEHDKFFH_08690 [Marinobacter maroccanus]